MAKNKDFNRAEYREAYTLNGNNTQPTKIEGMEIGPPSSYRTIHSFIHLLRQNKSGGLKNIK